MVATTVAVMGSTGSIGTQTLEIIQDHPDEFEVVVLGAAKSVELLIEQAKKHEPQIVAISDPLLEKELRQKLPPQIDVISGPEALANSCPVADVVINGVVGFAGLPITISALKAGKRLGLANKESLIAAGPLIQNFRSIEGAELIPVDSEHCAIHQCLGLNATQKDIKNIVLTASGGPFRGFSAERLRSVSIEDALSHPTWDMGPKITVDSSTLMNKGLEVIEAHELFGIPYENIDVVIHPQSIVHSMVTFSDGATLAQMSNPDMRLCIAYALTYPDRINDPFGEIDWSKMIELNFEPPDKKSFPCLNIAYEAGRQKGTAPAWLNAANEEAVSAFLSGRLLWKEISEVISATLQEWSGENADSIETVLKADSDARLIASELIKSRN
ncbi:MAG: 1-deoxy-D-xylulose-5-phosphate reductoisomerase [Acidimicrobiales bacterium]|nr:1-deoxy-D-xylulose-5-phosphate reductoisomerase [Acidimicrobiales bacterium]|tara:strand:- start:2788 stop:3945 length:1158 start_codon:yes stop_codon:yes gene_type:complete